ncbi:MAG: rod shape-determining protein RodA [Acidobacteria bacterium]|nr:rod shape-determining protein RodA [Acidobacteriota bacterium]MBU4330390.1 rod shape-determining protein RodA [Acidobacteriota bacterium]MBU4496272.1 rod shape-determining protein RodA [Acidobacteriota bacterium]
MINRQFVNNIDWILFGLFLINVLIGVAFIYSASQHLPGQFFLRQMIFVFVSLIALFLCVSIDYRYFTEFSLFAYVLLIGVLGGNLLFGRLIAGTKSWIRIAFFQIQPSEFMKIVLILVLAHLFSKFRSNTLQFRQGFLAGVATALPVGLITLQPDLGTALTLLPILLAAYILTGVNYKFVAIALIFLILAGFLAWNFALKDYQKQRLSTVIFPERDPLGAGYQIIQSKIAIGSGGLLGKGFKKGTQSQLRFLPARHTDFIFSVIGEETGFIGVVVVLFLYLLMLRRIFLSVEKTRDRAGAYLVFMVAVLLSAQFFINISMTIGLFPVAGIPLPFLSYGGSSLLANSIGIGLVLNVRMRRFVNV